jgi:2-polyprenyl-3-methyl-5-hydroxy-6-metoxy-1,4-benzoquinol methylase
MKIKDYFYSQDVFEVLPSKHEGVLETFPKLNEAELSGYYNHENYISHQTKSKTLLEKVYQVAKRVMIKRKQNKVFNFCKSGRILDIGTGTGDFLKSFDSKSWEKFAIEPNEGLHKALKNEKIHILKSVEEIQHQQFDVITLWHALEHIPNLEGTLQRIQSSLNPDGVLIIAVPNYNSYDAAFYKTHWAAWDVPRHVWHFSKSGLISLCQKFNFEFVTNSPLLLDAFYISIISEKYRNSNNMLRAFCVGLYSNLLGLFKNEYSSFVYVLNAKGSKAINTYS